MLTNVEKSLYTFKNRVQKNARRNIKKKSSSSKLQQSIKGKVIKTREGYEIPFEMADYAMYVDQGVKGKGGTKADGSKWKRKRVTTKSYKYKNKQPPIKAFEQWAKKNIPNPRDSKGRFITRRSLTFALSKHVYHTGLKTTLFFTRPWERQLKILENDLGDSFAKDILDAI
jgi:hypothetical protein